ncbi:Histidine biosynthesis bifunctional protein hisB [Friedmanniomyces endolithicus]|nr:Histidine biosynthesis bifunctional protein hisB [Friedmanniomyces endolithicus]
MPTVHLLDYAAGNIRSLVNAIEKLGWQVEWVTSPEDVSKAEKLILPGVGHFGHCLTQFSNAGYVEPVKAHIQAGKPFMGICVGLQALFEGSAESPAVPGLGVAKGYLERFRNEDKSVPHIGWNSANSQSEDRHSSRQSVYGLRPDSKYYYVHSYAVPYREGELEKDGWSVATARYGSEEFVGAVARENVLATQFHPEKSGAAGLRVLKAFLEGKQSQALPSDIMPALDVATLYFKSGADKVSIGSDAVTAAEQYHASNRNLTGKTAIETISEAYGAQAVVVSVDPRRVYVASPESTTHHTLKSTTPGPQGEMYYWYACTIKGGRETRDLDVIQLVTAVEAMGAGEILLNCIDKDGTNSGFDLELVKSVKAAVKIPVIASSGAGNADHFAEVFQRTNVDAALGAGMFHRGEWTVKQVKEELSKKGLMIRRFEEDI